jgi:2-isopropylmalate synthase
MSTRDVYLYDTTLRDGEQGEFISYSLEDKVRITHRLDEFGMDYIEGGWPGSNPKALHFFEKMKSTRLQHAKLAAFGSTRRKGVAAADDTQLQTLVASGTPVVTIFGKTWDLHVREALRVSEQENVDMIGESVAYLKSCDREVVYDCEHFFDGFKANPEYALKTLKAAADAGASVIVLCDTNGGTMPTEFHDIMTRVKSVIKSPLGIHAHNDCGMGVINSCTAVLEGAVHVQGTVNGYGERCGNADLIQIIPNLELKFGRRCLDEGKLQELTSVSHFVAEIANLAPDPRQPYVGQTVFAHKGGIHVSAVQRNPATYEHIPPETVGNQRRVLVSELSGMSNINYKATELGLNLDESNAEARAIVQQIKQLEAEGYQFESAEASFELLVKKAQGKGRNYFDLTGFRVITSHTSNSNLAEAILKLNVNGENRHVVAEGDGPVNALDKALRKALVEDYPSLKKVHLIDFKVRVLNAQAATAARVRVIIESTDGEDAWTTVGVSEDVVEASYKALVDSIEFYLLKQEEALTTA